MSSKPSMKNIPKTQNALVLRTDFSDDAAWRSTCAAIQEAVDIGCVECLSDPDFDGLTAQHLAASLTPLLSLERKPSEYQQSFIFIVDQIALNHPDHAILVVDLCVEHGRTFRVIPSQMLGVASNLFIANMDFAEFADHTDEDGVFRGFPGT
jgi:hypothetical protein